MRKLILIFAVSIALMLTAFKSEPHTVLFTGDLLYAEGDCLQVTGHQKDVNYSSYTGYVFFVKKRGFDKAMSEKGKADWESLYKNSDFAWAENGKFSIELPVDSFVVVPEVKITSRHHIYLNSQADTVKKEIHFFRCISQ